MPGAITLMTTPDYMTVGVKYEKTLLISGNQQEGPQRAYRHFVYDIQFVYFAAKPS